MERPLTEQRGLPGLVVQGPAASFERKNKKTAQHSNTTVSLTAFLKNSLGILKSKEGPLIHSISETSLNV